MQWHTKESWAGYTWDKNVFSISEVILYYYVIVFTCFIILLFKRSAHSAVPSRWYVTLCYVM